MKVYFSHCLGYTFYRTKNMHLIKRQIKINQSYRLTFIDHKFIIWLEPKLIDYQGGNLNGINTNCS